MDTRELDGNFKQAQLERIAIMLGMGMTPESIQAITQIDDNALNQIDDIVQMEDDEDGSTEERGRGNTKDTDGKTKINIEPDKE